MENAKVSKLELAMAVNHVKDAIGLITKYNQNAIVTIVGDRCEMELNNLLIRENLAQVEALLSQAWRQLIVKDEKQKA